MGWLGDSVMEDTDYLTTDLHYVPTGTNPVSQLNAVRAKALQQNKTCAI